MSIPRIAGARDVPGRIELAGQLFLPGDVERQDVEALEVPALQRHLFDSIGQARPVPGNEPPWLPAHLPVPWLPPLM
jgi:hypothetical protein